MLTSSTIGGSGPVANFRAVDKFAIPESILVSTARDGYGKGPYGANDSPA